MIIFSRVMSQQQASICEQRLVLVRDYRETTKIYAESVADLTDLVKSGLESEADLVRRTCRAAWDAAETARLALFRHEADHGCNRIDFSAKHAGLNLARARR